MSEPLIDLGELHGHDDRRPPDELDWSAPPAGAARRRQWPVVAVLALVIPFATGSRPAGAVEDLGVLAEHTAGFVADRTALYALRGEPALSAYDWHTGQDRAELAGWGVVPSATTGTEDDGGAAIAGVSTSFTVVQKPAGNSSQVARIDLRTGEITPLGHVSPIPSRCAIRYQRLSCLAGGDSVRLWRLPD